MCCCLQKLLSRWHYTTLWNCIDICDIEPLKEPTYFRYNATAAPSTGNNGTGRRKWRRPTLNLHSQAVIFPCIIQCCFGVITLNLLRVVGIIALVVFPTNAQQTASSRATIVAFTSGIYQANWGFLLAIVEFHLRVPCLFPKPLITVHFEHWFGMDTFMLKEGL